MTIEHLEFNEACEVAMILADKEAESGATDISFSLTEKRYAIMTANSLRRKYDCYIQEAGGLWYVVVDLLLF